MGTVLADHLAVALCFLTATVVIAMTPHATRYLDRRGERRTAEQREQRLLDWALVAHQFGLDVDLPAAMRAQRRRAR